MEIVSRVRHVKMVPTDDLIAHPMNWRKHSDKQKAAVASAISEIGFCDALIVRELEPNDRLGIHKGQYEILNGHLRADICAHQSVPCLVVDLTDEEARKFLAVYDPLQSMADTDFHKLNDLAGQIGVFQQADLTVLLHELLSTDPPDRDDDDEEDDDGATPAPNMKTYTIVLTAEEALHFDEQLDVIRGEKGTIKAAIMRAVDVLSTELRGPSG